MRLVRQKTGLLLLVIAGCLMFPASELRADSFTLLSDLKYQVTQTETTDKSDNSKIKNENATFSQLYNLEVQKEIFPTLNLNAGGLFDQDNTRSESNVGAGNESRLTSIRPFIDLQFSSKLLTAAAGYRKNEFKRSSTSQATDRNYTEEYSARLNWEPVELPEVGLYFTRNLAYNEQRTNDQQVDNYQFRSSYFYQHFDIAYNHTTNIALNQASDFETQTDSDDGSIRFSKTYRQGAISVNSSLRGNRQQISFSGTGDRFISTASVGSVEGRVEDPSPVSSDPEDGFLLADIDLLVNSATEAKQLSFGLDYASKTEVDRILIYLNGLNSTNVSSSNFSWAVYVRDNTTDLWVSVAGVVNNTDLQNGRFEISFPKQEKRFIKIVTTPLHVDTEKVLTISRLVGERALPADTSTFTSTDWTSDLFLTWRLNNKTTVGTDFLYREQRSSGGLDDKKTLLNTGARIRHIFNDVFTGNMNLQRSETRKQGEGPSTRHSLSTALSADYLDTFNQSLTYSFSHQNDEDNRTTISNALFLRNNLDLYQGWSLFLDSGYNWQNPAEGEDLNTTFLRLGSNIVPNRWLNTSFSYGVSWTRESGKPVSRDQNGRAVITWVPTKSLSFSADLTFSDKVGGEKDSTARQQYFINWSPFRDGTLFFSLSYGQSQNDDNETNWSLSPRLRWKINRATLLTLDYAIGEREDRDELVEFENISLALRIFY